MQKKKDYKKHKVVSCIKNSNNTYLLSFKREFDFIPGQVVALSLALNQKHRLYSIASNNTGELMTVFFDVKENGFLTPKLAQLKEGDEIWVSEPFGNFTSSNNKEWWIATGTGVAPFISRLKSEEKLPEIFIHGARYINQFYFRDFIKERLPKRYKCFCTKESNPEINFGRLTNWLSAQNNLPKDIKYYLCGSPEMVVDVRDLLLSKGVDFENIMAEIYF